MLEFRDLVSEIPGTVRLDFQCTAIMLNGFLGLTISCQSKSRVEVIRVLINLRDVLPRALMHNESLQQKFSRIQEIAAVVCDNPLLETLAGVAVVLALRECLPVAGVQPCQIAIGALGRSETTFPFRCLRLFQQVLLPIRQCR